MTEPKKELTDREGCGILIMTAGCMVPIVIVVVGMLVLIASVIL